MEKIELNGLSRYKLEKYLENVKISNNAKEMITQRWKDENRNVQEELRIK